LSRSTHRVGSWTRPGAYAFLLGAGVSKDAGVPTGGDVRALALSDLYRLSNPDAEPPNDESLDFWAKEKGYADISYSDILEQLGPDAEGRRAYLAKHFADRAPGETHRLLARLAADGLVRVFVTTNFDRLLEQTLREAGITPVVITADDELQRASEREHARCYVLKVHGDYLQQTIRNGARNARTEDRGGAAGDRRSVRPCRARLLRLG
jgi:NAD-dependent SIR2 family protein deacetylase